jgi:uncharacterized protein
MGLSPITMNRRVDESGIATPASPRLPVSPSPFLFPDRPLIRGSAIKYTIYMRAYEAIVERLVVAYQPIALFLFGSQAWGPVHEGSDIDILVVVKSTNLDQAQRIRNGARALFGLGLDVDLIVLTEAELEQNNNHPSALINKILEKGIKLYETA